ncbi:hypothetical protein SASPL_145931 [Salvia splendens]|uniref:Uncharacterized protein n=1 Tax=Salvia splendens TaxID=180675 RepID=A0A8X8WJQ5_SALSN|nr:hypothetical protein SASPL_145931 [Salvia splendens]
MESEVPVTETLQLGPTRQRNIGEIGGRPQSTDPITLGFEQLNARFDKMDRRVANLERRADWDKRHRRYTQPTYRRPQHHQSDRYTPSPPYQPDRCRPYHLHQTRYQLPEHYHPFDYGPPPTYRGFPLRQFLQLQNEPSRQPSCWDPPGAGVSMGNLDYEEIASIYYPDYDCDSVGYGEDADVHHDPSSNSQLTVIVVPPPPPQRSSSCLSMTSHCPWKHGRTEIIPNEQGNRTTPLHMRLDAWQLQHVYHEQPSYWPVTAAALQPPFTYTDPYSQSPSYTDPYSQSQYYTDPYTNPPPQHSSCWGPTNHYHQGVY